MPQVCGIKIWGPTYRKIIPFEAASTASAAFLNKRQRQTRVPRHPRWEPKPHLLFAALGTRKTVRLLGRGARTEGSPGGVKGRIPQAPSSPGRPGGRVPELGEEPSGTGTRRPSRRERSAAQRPPAAAPATFSGSVAGGERLGGLRGDKSRGAGEGCRVGITGRGGCETGSGAGSAERRREPGRGAPGGLGTRAESGARAAERPGRGSRAGARPAGSERERRTEPRLQGEPGRAASHPGGVSGRSERRGLQGWVPPQPRGTERGGPGAEPPRSPGAGARRRRPHGRRRGRLCAGLARRG